MSLLTIVQDACDTLGLPRPSTVYGSADPNTRLLLAQANREGREQSRRHDWQRLRLEATISTVASTVSYDLPSGFDRIVEGSIWNRTQTRPIIGPISSQRWQMLQAQAITATWQALYVRGGNILITPTPSAVETIGYEYLTQNWCSPAAGTEPTQTAWGDDADVHYLDDEVFVLGVAWRFLRARGLDYAEAMRLYEDALNSRKAHDGGQRVLDLSSEPGATVNAPFVEDGNWTI